MLFYLIVYVFYLVSFLTLRSSRVSSKISKMSLGFWIKWSKTRCFPFFVEKCIFNQIGV